MTWGTWHKIPGRWRYCKSYWQPVYINKKHQYIWNEGYWWYDKPRWVWIDY